MSKLSRRTFVAALLAAPAAARAQSDADLDRPIEDLYAGLEMVMKAGRSTPFSQRFDTLAPAVDRAFDLETILKVSVGLRWDGLGADMQARLLKTFRRFTVATYVANFDKYEGEKFKVDPGARDSGAERIVRTEITGMNGDPIRLDYVMRDERGQWRAVDVLLDGTISRVAVQRSDFRQLLASGEADALIASLRKKISSLSDGALSS